MISLPEYQARIERIKEVMREKGIDCLALSAGADLAYLTGYVGMPLERITLFVLGAYAPPTMIVPSLEVPRVFTEGGIFQLRAWADHENMMTVCANAIRAAAPPNPTVAINNTMRADHVLGLQHEMRFSRFVNADKVLRDLRVIKSAAEVHLLKDAAAAIDSVVGQLGELDWVGRTEKDMATDISSRILTVGHENVEFVIVGSGENGASPHHEPGDRTIARGDVVVVDIGGSKDGYCSDTTRCVAIGTPSDQVQQAYAALRSAQEAAVAAVRPGVTCSEIDAVARGALNESGYGKHFIHRTGHGIGLEVHEEPYLVAGNDEALVAGMCFSVEPGIYVDGQFGLRLEDIVAVTETGVESLNTTPHDLIVVGD